MKKLVTGIVIIAVIVVIILVATNKKASVPIVDQSETPSTVTETTGTATMNPGDTVTASSEKTFTLTDVAKHATEADCYAAIDGKVYDLTAWIKKHPGGDRAILSICGKDGSSAFNGQHGSDKKPHEILAGFEVGVLAQ